MIEDWYIDCTCHYCESAEHPRENYLKEHIKQLELINETQTNSMKRLREENERMETALVEIVKLWEAIPYDGEGYKAKNFPGMTTRFMNIAARGLFDN